MLCFEITDYTGNIQSRFHGCHGNSVEIWHVPCKLGCPIMSVCMQCYAVPRNTALLINLKSVPENLVSESVAEKVQYHQGE